MVPQNKKNNRSKKSVMTQQRSTLTSISAPAALGQIGKGNCYTFGVASHPELGKGLKLRFHAKLGYMQYNTTIATQQLVPYNGGSSLAVNSYYMSPSNPVGPIGLLYLSKGFDQFVYRKLRFVMMSQSATNTGGGIQYGFVRDANRSSTLDSLSNATKLSAIAEVAGSMTLSNWQSASIDVPVDDVPRYVGAATFAIAANARQNYAGTLQYAATSGVTAVSHDVYIEGEVDLFGFDPYFINNAGMADEKTPPPPTLRRDDTDVVAAPAAAADRPVSAAPTPVAIQQRPPGARWFAG